jgi:hypothetical protein
MPVHCVRKRDNAVLTHILSLALTEEEAVVVSEYFKKMNSEVGMTYSLIRAFLLFESLNAIDEKFLVEQMAKISLLSKLKNELTAVDYCMAVGLLKDHKEKKLEKQQTKQNDTPKKQKPQIVEPKIKPKRDRNFVPEIVIVKKRV